MSFCPECGGFLSRSGDCCNCDYPFVKIGVPPEVRRRRKVVDIINKNAKVAEKVAEFLGVR